MDQDAPPSRTTARTATVLAIEPVLDISALPPGPRGPKALTAARFLLRGPGFLERCRDRYGHVFTIRLNTGRTVIVAGDPAIAKEVFTGSPDDLHAGAGNAVLKPLLGSRSVLLLDGPEHLRQRKLMLPPFHGERMRAYGELMGEIADRHIDRWPVGQPFAVRDSVQAITLEIILRTVFGLEQADEVERMAQPLRRLLDSTTHPARLLALQFTSSERNGGPRTPWGRIRALLAPADQMLFEQIRTRRAEQERGEGTERDDILSLLLAARDEDGTPLTDRELRDELMTLLVAGHETTATALAWTLERVVRHPDVLARLRAEVEEGGSEYLEATIKETLRLRPVVPGVIRRLQRPLEIGGMSLPAGVHIAPSIYLIHRRADVYPEPEAFRPERFLERTPSTYEWLPFGGGIRRCLGASFALYEMRIVLETILRRAELETTGADSERVIRRFVTFTPAHGGRVRVGRLAPARPVQAGVAA